MNSSAAITHLFQCQLRLTGRRIIVSFFSLCLLLGLAQRTVRAEELRAGTAKIDITPTQPVTLAGYASRKDLSQGVHDPLSARAVAFEQDGRRLVLVSVDNLGFYSGTAEPLRQAILAASAVQPSELFLCAIHTHSAPSLTLNAEKGHPNNVEYTKQLREKLVEVVRSALDRLAPVRIGIGSGSSPVGVNRRETVIDNILAYPLELSRGRIRSPKQFFCPGRGCTIDRRNGGRLAAVISGHELS